MSLLKNETTTKTNSNSSDFHTKILKEVIFIFHFFSDMRQHYLMSNSIEYFYSEIFEKSKQMQRDDALYEELTHKLNSEFNYLVPNSEEFHNHLSYELPNISKMYEN